MNLKVISAAFADWIERHALPCVYKQCFGLCCPFCGFQRSVIALLKGDVAQSFLLYPALLPTVVSVAGLLLFRSRQRRQRYLKWIVVIDASMMIIGALLKNIGVLPR